MSEKNKDSRQSLAHAVATLTRVGEPYELAIRERRGGPERYFVNAPESLRQLFEETASTLPFIVYEDERLSFAETWRTASALGHALVERYGVAKGDRVAISMRNYPEWIIAFTAITAIGAIAVAMNALWRGDELDFALQDSGAKVLFADGERLDRLATMGNPLALQVVGVRAPAHPRADVAYLTLLAEARAARLPEVAIGPDDPAIMLYTSGSTGRPKGVLSSHRNILSALWSWELDAAAAALISDAPPPVHSGQTAALLAIPLFHVTGLHAVYLTAYRAQQRIVSMYKWDPFKAAELIERERVTRFVAPSAVTGDMVRVAKETGRDLSSLLTIGGGGAPRPAEQVLQIPNAFPSAVPATGWGMTETNAIGVGIAGDDYIKHPLSSGRASTVLDLKVVSPDGEALPPGERGELLVRGASVFVGYWNRPDADVASFTDGWFHTGDVAYIDEAGFVFIVDRIKDLIIRGGENIGCGRVEDALLAHPSVYEAAVYSVPDARLGEEVGATIYAASDLELESLKAFLGARLATFEVPRYITFSDAPLRRTASGKILKRDIRAAALDNVLATVDLS